MPPKKKPRLTPSASSPPAVTTAAPVTPALSIPSAQPSTPHILDLSDPWSSEQETSLFKALIRYKPTGTHKHFHMLCISSFLHSHGHCASSDKSQSHIVQHTRIPAIWSKLSTLYDLEALDEREDSYNYASPDEESNTDSDGEDGDSNGEDHNGSRKPPPFMKEFALPSFIPERKLSCVSSSNTDEDIDATILSQHPDALDFTELVWQKRLHTASDAPSSPPEIPFLLEQIWRKGPSTCASPALSGRRAATGRAAKVQTPVASAIARRQSKVSQAQSTPATVPSKRKSRGEVKPDSEAEDESEEVEDDDSEDSGGSSQDQDEDEDDAEEDEEEEDDEPDGKATPARATPKTRGASKRGRGSTGRGGSAAAAKSRGGSGRGRGRGRGVGRKRG